MILGILSDTHDRADAMHRAIDLLTRAGATYFIHCGDVGSIHILDSLAGLPAAFVWGNTDYDRAELKRYADSIGVQCLGASGQLTLAHKKIAVLHGDDFHLKQKFLESQAFDYLLHGHTHLRTDERIGKTRLINPGALHRAATKTVATLDLTQDLLKFHTLPAQ